MKTINQTYLEGIKEGRSFLTANPGMTLDDIKRHVSNLKTLARDSNQPIKDLYKGEIDFFTNRMKIFKQ